jgi:hypothetical protein
MNKIFIAKSKNSSKCISIKKLYSQLLAVIGPRAGSGDGTLRNQSRSRNKWFRLLSTASHTNISVISQNRNNEIPESVQTEFPTGGRSSLETRRYLNENSVEEGQDPLGNGGSSTRGHFDRNGPVQSEKQVQ